MPEDERLLNFKLLATITKSSIQKVDGKFRRVVEGIASLETPDQEGETIVQRGIDFAPLLKSGHINFDHGPARKSRIDDIIGYPLDAKVITVPGKGVPGLWVRGWLFDDPENKPQADAVWRHMVAVQKSGAGQPLGWSVEGKARWRSGKRIVESVINNLAITHQPVHADTFVNYQELAKSFAALEHLPEETIFGAGPDLLEQIHLAILKSEGEGGAEIGDHNAVTIGQLTPLLRESGDFKRVKPKKGVGKTGKLKNALAGIYNCKNGCYNADGIWKSGRAGMRACLTDHQGWEPEEAEVMAEVFGRGFSA